ncbi:unnamed protein product [Dovyalis caffra]|uniref:Uncharacterized protein n=1 Tax=Dovyalis caffra TaxID=77055 RepID=A0AAV1ST18_9ROSI|nr:unnamed protein product [Dovyalis caffra]
MVVQATGKQIDDEDSDTLIANHDLYTLKSKGILSSGVWKLNFILSSKSHKQDDEDSDALIANHGLHILERIKEKNRRGEQGERLGIRIQSSTSQLFVLGKAHKHGRPFLPSFKA